MSWHYSQVLVEEYLQVTSLDGKQSVQLKSMNTAEKCLCTDKTKDSLHHFPSGMMSQPLMEDPGKDLLMWFLEVSLVKTSAHVESMQGLMEREAAFGQRWQGLSLKFCLNSSMWKTHHCLFPEVLQESSVTLPRWGMMQDGELWEYITPPMAGTKEKDAGFWPTVTVDCRTMRKNKYKQRGTPLTYAVMLKDKCSGGFLNPVWIEWLMGFPMGWTDLNIEDLDMESWRAPDYWIEDPADSGLVNRTRPKMKKRRAMLTALGNAQVPACAFLAWNILFKIGEQNG